MRHILQFLALTIMLIVSVESAPRMRKYIGSGYDIFFGDPLKDGFDTGFRTQPVFDLQYNGRTTQDGNFQITDNVQVKDISACSFSGQSQTISGTQSFQKSVGNKVGVSGEYNGGFAGGKFSASASWDNFQKTTTAQDSSVILSISECQAYTLTLSSFNIDSSKLDKTFMKAVIESYQSRNWNQFIKEYGTHYVWDVMMGGRITGKTTITNTAIGQIRTEGIDLSASAEVTFTAGKVGAQFQNVQSSQANSYTKNFQKNSKVFYLGGDPTGPKNKDDWLPSVKLRPMPISYKLYQIPSLFRYIPGLPASADDVKRSFYEGMDQYCRQNGCKDKPTPDKRIPSKYIYRTRKTAIIGGNYGTPFARTCPKVTQKVTQIALSVSNYAKGIRIVCTDGLKRDSFEFGQMNHKIDKFQLIDQQTISRIEMTSGSYVDSITIFTNANVMQALGRPQGGSRKPTIYIKEGFQIVGVYGAAGNDLNRVGFIMGKAVPIYNSHSHMSMLIHQKATARTHETAHTDTHNSKLTHNTLKSHF